MDRIDPYLFGSGAGRLLAACSYYSIYSTAVVHFVVIVYKDPVVVVG